MKAMKTEKLISLIFTLLSFLLAGCATRSIFVGPGYDPQICVPLLRHNATAAMVWVARHGNLQDSGLELKGSVVSLATETPRLGTPIILAGPADISGPVITTAGAGQYFIAWQEGNKLYGKVVRESNLMNVSGGATDLTPGDALHQKHNYDVAYDPSLKRIIVVYVAAIGSGELRSRIIRLDRLATVPVLTPDPANVIRTPAGTSTVRLPRLTVPINDAASAVPGIPYLVVWLEGAQAHGSAADVNGVTVPSSHFLISNASEFGCERVAACFDRAARNYLVLFDQLDSDTATGTIKASTVTLGPGIPAVTPSVALVTRTAGADPARPRERNSAYKLGETPDLPDWGGVHAGPRPCIFAPVMPLASVRSDARLIYRETKNPLTPIGDPRDHFFAENLAVLPFDATLATRTVTHDSTGPNPILKGGGDAKLGRDGQLLIFYEDFAVPEFVRGPVAAAPRQSRLFYPRAPYLWLEWLSW
jgi:hypothetical protein